MMETGVPGRGGGGGIGGDGDGDGDGMEVVAGDSMLFSNLYVKTALFICPSLKVSCAI